MIVILLDKKIESAHPVDVLFEAKKLSKRQLAILDKLKGYGSQVIVKKRDVSMLDLAAMTAATGDEFAMFTRTGERLIVRGNSINVPLNKFELIGLCKAGYRFSGHTHPGFSDASLLISDGDKMALEIFDQKRSVVYNAVGRFKLVE